MNVQTPSEKLVKPFDCQHYINGRYFPSEKGKTFDNINPATQEIIGSVAEGGKKEVDLAVAANPGVH